MIKKIFITGLPGCGKTTLIKEILKELDLKSFGGFFTEEIREKGERVGFKIVTLNGKEGILAHKDLKSNFKVSKYGVNIKDLEEIGVKAILEAQKEGKIIVVDEIGKMELFSEKFKRAIENILNSENKVLGTIMLKENPFCDSIKKRKNVKVFHLTRENKEIIKKEILSFLRRPNN